MSSNYRKDIEILIKLIHIYIADIFIEYEKQSGNIPESIYIYNECIYNNIENDKFTTWLYNKGINCNKITDIDLLKYIINQIDENYIAKKYLLEDKTFSPYLIINTFARYEADKSLIIKD